eukprot:s4574_g3.t1
MLLNQIGAMNPESLERIGQEEFEEASERSLGKQSLKRVVKSVADGDYYAGYLDERINQLAGQCERLDTQRDMLKDKLMDEITRVSNESSMDRDYCTGLHFAIVENGGYVEHAPGLTNDQLIHMMTLERANLVTSRTMGSNQYMQLVRQRAVPRGQADETDQEESESDSNAEDMEVDAGNATAATAIPGTVTDMTEFLKDEHLACVQRGELRDAGVIQNLIVEFLQMAANGLNDQSVSRCRVRISAVFTELMRVAADQNRWVSSTRYDRTSEDFRT